MKPLIGSVLAALILAVALPNLANAATCARWQPGYWRTGYWDAYGRWARPSWVPGQCLAYAPPPAYHSPPPAPSSLAVWNPGHWEWNGAQYVWVPGRYL